MTAQLTEIKELVQEQVITTEEYKRVIKQIHTSTVGNVIRNNPANRVPNSPPPDISSHEEKQLPRATRVELAADLDLASQET